MGRGEASGGRLGRRPCGGPGACLQLGPAQVAAMGGRRRRAYGRLPLSAWWASRSAHARLPAAPGPGSNTGVRAWRQEPLAGTRHAPHAHLETRDRASCCSAQQHLHRQRPCTVPPPSLWPAAHLEDGGVHVGDAAQRQHRHPHRLAHADLNGRHVAPEVAARGHGVAERRRQKRHRASRGGTASGRRRRPRAAAGCRPRRDSRAPRTLALL